MAAMSCDVYAQLFRTLCIIITALCFELDVPVVDARDATPQKS